jgi:hypothetical protein
VHGDGALGHTQGFRDLAVRPPEAHLGDDIDLTRGQVPTAASRPAPQLAIQPIGRTP